MLHVATILNKKFDKRNKLYQVLQRLFCFQCVKLPSFLSFYRSLKVYWAKEWLENSTLTVVAISESLGFQDSSYFIKVFKKETGMTPLAYRKKKISYEKKGESKKFSV